MNIYLENVYEDIPDRLVTLHDRLDHPEFHLCLDVGHVNAMSELPLEYWLSAFGPCIGHIHIHNNDGKTDDHQGLSDGTLDYQQVLPMFTQYCPDAWLNLELRDGIDQSIAILREYMGSLGA